MREQYAGSVEYQNWVVTATKNGARYDPSLDLIQFALTTTSVEPVSGWAAGVWSVNAPGQHVASVLVGVGTPLPLVAGTLYYVWLKITDNPEIPVRLVDTLKAL